LIIAARLLYSSLDLYFRALKLAAMLSSLLPLVLLRCSSRKETRDEQVDDGFDGSAAKRACMSQSDLPLTLNKRHS
jgi:hypothetical protein